MRVCAGRRRARGVFCTPRLSKAQRQNLLTALVLSLALLLCLQVGIFLPILVRFQDGDGGSPLDNQLLAMSNGRSVQGEESSPWKDFHRLPKVCTGGIGHACVCVLT